MKLYRTEIVCPLAELRRSGIIAVSQEIFKGDFISTDCIQQHLPDCNL